MPEGKFNLEAYEKRLLEKLRKPTPQLPDRQGLVTSLLEKARGLKRLPRR